jgi:methyltransferase
MVIDSRALYLALVVLVAAQRFAELGKSADNEATLRARGAIEHAPEQMRWMRLLHGAWLVAAPVEVFLFKRPFVLWIAIAASVVFLVGQVLRLWTQRTLGVRWTVKILTIPGLSPVTEGPFRLLRHPNYLGVALEIAALPMIHGAWITAIVFTAANAALMVARISAEERALDRAAAMPVKLPTPRGAW